MKIIKQQKRNVMSEMLRNMLSAIQEQGHFISFDIIPSPDKRTFRFGLGINGKNNIDWLTYNEMSQFLRGYMFALRNNDSFYSEKILENTIF